MWSFLSRQRTPVRYTQLVTQDDDEVDVELANLRHHPPELVVDMNNLPLTFPEDGKIRTVTALWVLSQRVAITAWLVTSYMAAANATMNKKEKIHLLEPGIVITLAVLLLAWCFQLACGGAFTAFHVRHKSLFFQSQLRDLRSLDTRPNAMQTPRGVLPIYLFPRQIFFVGIAHLLVTTAAIVLVFAWSTSRGPNEHSGLFFFLFPTNVALAAVLVYFDPLDAEAIGPIVIMNSELLIACSGFIVYLGYVVLRPGNLLNSLLLFYLYGVIGMALDQCTKCFSGCARCCFRICQRRCIRREPADPHQQQLADPNNAPREIREGGGEQRRGDGREQRNQNDGCGEVLQRCSSPVSRQCTQCAQRSDLYPASLCVPDYMARVPPMFNPSPTIASPMDEDDATVCQ